MITVRHETNFETAAELADWLETTQPSDGMLVAQVGTTTIYISFGPRATAVKRQAMDAGANEVAFASPRDARLRWLRLIRDAADASADGYEGKKLLR